MFRCSPWAVWAIWQLSGRGSSVYARHGWWWGWSVVGVVSCVEGDVGDRARPLGRGVEQPAQRPFERRLWVARVRSTPPGCAAMNAMASAMQERSFPLRPRVALLTASTGCGGTRAGRSGRRARCAWRVAGAGPGRCARSVGGVSGGWPSVREAHLPALPFGDQLVGDPLVGAQVLGFLRADRGAKASTTGARGHDQADRWKRGRRHLIPPPLGDVSVQYCVLDGTWGVWCLAAGRQWLG